MNNVREQIDRAGDRRSFINRALGLGPSRMILKNLEGCASCHACVRACPNGALSFVLNDGWGSKLWNRRSCQRCGCCVETCPDHLLEFTSGVAIRTDAEESLKLTEFRFSACPGCGAMVPETEGRICVTCRKRGGCR